MPRGSRPGPSRGGGNRRGGGAATASRGPYVPRPRVPEVPQVREVDLPQTMTVRQLAESLRVSAVDIIKELMKNGILASINQIVDYTTAAIVATDMGFEPREAKAVEVEIAAGPDEMKARRMREDDPSLLETRPPVVTIMGHVDHGKTSLLDAIRSANVTATEFGGITQHIGAYQVEIDGRKITFLDTPGHEAFTAMRARGAQVTDIAVIVVAADDGIMPQTVEAIDHAKAAGVPIVVAINKIDKEEANPERVKRELTEHGLVVEAWGGDTIAVEVSAKAKLGLEDLLENLLLVADVQDLKGNPHRRAEGVVLEANLDTSRGPMATVLVHNGTLKVGDTIAAGNTSGRIKAMFNDRGKPLKKAEPSMPAKILGLSAVPSAGDLLTGFSDDKSARAYLESRSRSQQDGGPAGPITLQEINARIQAGQIKELNLVLKTDVHGSIEPIRQSLEKLGNENLRVKLLHLASGTVTESDVMLALASKGIVIGFNTRPEPGARRLAEQEGVEIRQYNVIYQLVEDIEKALTGLLEPTYVDVVDGHAEVRQVFKLGKREQVAGSYIRDGKVTRNSLVKVMRGRDVLVESAHIGSLKRLKDDAREVLAGYECGIVLEGFNDFEEGDVMEFFHKERQ